MIDSQRGYNHLISNKREWNNCFIKNHQQILLDFADFAWLEQLEGNLLDTISRVWCSGSYTIAAKSCEKSFVWKHEYMYEAKDVQGTCAIHERVY